MKRALRTRWADRIYLRRYLAMDENYLETVYFWHALRLRRMYGIRT